MAFLILTVLVFACSLKSNWVASEHESKTKERIDTDPEVVEHLIGDHKYINYSLKFKLRDHVDGLFKSLSSIDNTKKQSIAQTSFQFGENEKHELRSIEKGNRKKKNGDTEWGEQRERMKKLGLVNKS